MKTVVKKPISAAIISGIIVDALIQQITVV